MVITAEHLQLCHNVEASVLTLQAAYRECLCLTLFAPKGLRDSEKLVKIHCDSSFKNRDITSRTFEFQTN